MSEDRHPAIVIAHTIGGYQEANEGWHAEAFRKQGFATVTYPSMAVRRLVDGGAATAAWPSAVAEAYAAFRLLAEHPNIDADRIAIFGFSFGGEVAYLTAFERLRAALLPGEARFAAHVAFYPAGVYGGVAEQGGFTGAPILMLLGEKDDNLPVSKVQDYLAYVRKAGMPQPFERRDLSRRVARLDSPEPRRSAILSAVRQHSEMPELRDGAVDDDAARRRRADTDRSHHHAKLPARGPRLHDGLRRGDACKGAGDALGFLRRALKPYAAGTPGRPSRRDCPTRRRATVRSRRPPAGSGR